MQDVSKRTRNIVIMCVIAALFLVAILFFARDPAGAATVKPATPAPVSFDFQADAPLMAAAGGGPCHQWSWTPDWPQYDKFGHQAMDSQLDVVWNVGCKYQKIVGLDHLWCSDNGGTWDFNGCDKQHSPAGNYQMYAHATWHYTFFIAGIKFHSNPHVDLTMEANGHVFGTFYYDN